MEVLVYFIVTVVIFTFGGGARKTDLRRTWINRRIIGQTVPIRSHPAITWRDALRLGVVVDLIAVAVLIPVIKPNGVGIDCSIGVITLLVIGYVPAGVLTGLKRAVCRTITVAINVRIPIRRRDGVQGCALWVHTVPEWAHRGGTSCGQGL